MKQFFKNILIIFFSGAVFQVSAQPFDLMNVNSSNKVAQSSYYTVTRTSIHLFESTNFTHSTATVTGDTMIVARVPRSTTFIGEQNLTVTNFALDQNYPNPFNLTTVIRYSLPEPASVSIKVFDTAGREIATVVNDTKAAGMHSVGFGNNLLSSGTYFYRMIAHSMTGKTTVETKKMIVMK
ncbi:MAG: T9SS type A sorting domain-containing protein [Bacteroidota bacterium]|nr:T9SS type A sorting domain-containing protein [Bacteroidota bacterium]